jgi:NADPH2:quinone reductase
MKGVLCHAYGPPGQLAVEELPEPVPAEGEVLIAVEAAGLGYVDGLLVQGKYQLKTPLPFVPGSEIAGRVVAGGPGVGEEWIGRRVMALSTRGALAERIALPAALTFPIPEGMSAEAAAGFLVSYLTGLYGLEDCGHVAPGETVLVLGAAGGVGSAAIDVAKGLGARVVAAASSPEKLEACRARGADLTVDYAQPEWRKALEKLLGGRGLDVVYDPVGGAFSETAFRCLAPGGRHLVVGFAAGEIPRIPLNLPLLKRASIVGVDWGGEMRADRGVNARLLARLAELFAAGRIHPESPAVFPLAEAGAVLERLLARESIGKPVVRVGG